MSHRIYFTPEAEAALVALPAARARRVREGLHLRLTEAAQLALLRHFADAGAERFWLRAGDFEAHYSLDRTHGVLTVLQVVRLPSSRMPPVG